MSISDPQNFLVLSQGPLVCPQTWLRYVDAKPARVVLKQESPTGIFLILSLDSLGHVCHLCAIVAGIQVDFWQHHCTYLALERRFEFFSLSFTPCSLVHRASHSLNASFATTLD